MKRITKVLFALSIVLVSAVSYVLFSSNETEISANEEALGLEQPCRISDNWSVCDEHQRGAMCACGLDYSR